MQLRPWYVLDETAPQLSFLCWLRTHGIVLLVQEERLRAAGEPVADNGEGRLEHAAELTGPVTLLLYKRCGEPFVGTVWVLPVRATPRAAADIAVVCIGNVTGRCRKVQNLTLGRVLGAGAFGRVHIGVLSSHPHVDTTHILLAVSIVAQHVLPADTILTTGSTACRQARWRRRGSGSQGVGGGAAAGHQ